jgi:hypothetical protein
MSRFGGAAKEVLSSVEVRALEIGSMLDPNHGQSDIFRKRMTSDPQPAGGTNSLNGRSAFNNEDLAVLLKELHRVRDDAESDGQSAGEAMTLAGTAVRIVEAELGRAGPQGLSPADVAKAREVLHGALEALQAAAERVGQEPGSAEPGHRRIFRQRRKARLR